MLGRKIIATDVDKSADDIFPPRSPESYKVTLHDDDLLMVEYESGGHQSSTVYSKIHGRDVHRYITSYRKCKFYRLTPLKIDVVITASVVTNSTEE